jgi:hypothetical protein
MIGSSPWIRLPTELLGDLVAERLRALGVVGPHVHVHERPLALGGELGAEPVDVVVGAAHGHEVGPVDPGGQDLLLLEVGGDEDVRLEPGRRGVGGDRVGQVPRGGAGHDFVAELAGLRHGHRDHAVLERVRRVGRVVLDPHLADAEALGEPVGADQRSHPRRERGLRLALERQEVRVAPDRLGTGLDLAARLGGVQAREVVDHLERPKAVLADEPRLKRVARIALLALERLDSTSTVTHYVALRPSHPS